MGKHNRYFWQNNRDRIYPSEPAGIEAIFGGNYGKAFVDDIAIGTHYNSSYSWYITFEEYSNVNEYITDFKNNGSDWTMGKAWQGSNNCADFLEGMLDAASIAHPNFETWGKTDPDKVADWLDELNKNKGGRK